MYEGRHRRRTVFYVSFRIVGRVLLIFLLVALSLGISILFMAWMIQWIASYLVNNSGR